MFVNTLTYCLLRRWIKIIWYFFVWMPFLVMINEFLWCWSSDRCFANETHGIVMAMHLFEMSNQLRAILIFCVASMSETVRQVRWEFPLRNLTASFKNKINIQSSFKIFGYCYGGVFWTNAQIYPNMNKHFSYYKFSNIYVLTFQCDQIINTFTGFNLWDDRVEFNNPL